MKLVQTKKYLLLIDEEAEIKDGDYVTGDGIQYLSGVVNKVTQIHNGGIIVNNFTKLSMKGSIKITAYYPLTKEAKELDLPLLPNPFKEVDVEKLVDKEASMYVEKYASYKYESYMYNECKRIFKEGYKAAQSKQFSLEDMKKAFFSGRESLSKALVTDREAEEIIQSLSNQQLPKEFIPEVYQNRLYIKPEDLLVYESQPKEFQLPHTSKKGEVLKLKTIINPEGKEELVGTYKY